MKHFFSLVLLFTVCSLIAQCPTSVISLFTQGQVDSFKLRYPNCTSLEHELIIGGGQSKLSNLSGLSNLINVNRLVVVNAKGLSSLKGLDNLKSAGELWIQQNTNLSSLKGLEEIESVGQFLIIANDSLASMQGLGDLVALNEFSLSCNTDSFDVLGFLKVDSVKQMRLSGNIDLKGLSSIKYIEELVIERNEFLSDFNNIREDIRADIRNLNISNFDEFSFVGLDKFSEIWTLTLNAIDNIGMINVTGFERPIGLNFRECPSVNTFGYFKAVDIADLSLIGLNGVKSLSGLENCRNMKVLSLISNSMLHDINALTGSEELELLIVHNNTLLSECAIIPICQKLLSDTATTVRVENNGLRCSTIKEILNQCEVVSNKDLENNQLIISPNPFYDRITLPHKQQFVRYEMINQRSQIVRSSKINSDYIDMSMEPNGIYLLKLYRKDNSSIVIRLIKAK